MSTSFANNGTFSRGTAINQFDTDLSVNLAGMRTMANNRLILADSDNSHTLVGDYNANNRDAMLYDLVYNGGVNLNNTTQRFANSFTTFHLGYGADVLDLTVTRSNVPNYTANVTATGDHGDDVLWTGYGNDTLVGDRASSALLSLSLYASGFGDTLHGGDGADVLYGDFDQVSFASVTIGLFTLGDDVLYGGNGNDLMYGDYGGNSVLSATVGLLSYGDDVLNGGAGNDTIYGDIGGLGLVGVSGSLLGLGSDTIDGGAGDDVIYGDPGAPGSAVSVSVGGLSFVTDIIYGGSGNDTIVGDSADNLLSALSGGADQLYGGAGDDLIVGDYTGGLTSVVATLAVGNDSIDGGDGNDILVGDYRSSSGLTVANLLTFGNDTLKGGAGADTIYGDSSNTAITGLGAGSDRIEGGAGNDVLYGDYPVIVGLLGARDTFVFGADFGNDRIVDFHKRPLVDLTGTSDRIEIQASTGITNWAGLESHISYSGGDATITIGTNTIKVEGPDILSSLSPLHDYDFIFTA